MDTAHRGVLRDGRGGREAEDDRESRCGREGPAGLDIGVRAGDTTIPCRFYAGRDTGSDAHRTGAHTTIMTIMAAASIDGAAARSRRALSSQQGAPLCKFNTLVIAYISLFLYNEKNNVWSIYMIKELIANAAIMISAIAIANSFYKRCDYRAPRLYQRLLIGLIGGGLGCVLILYSIPVGPNLIVDLRMLPIIIIALYGSISSLTAAATVICVFRMFIFGISTTSIVGGLGVLAVALLCVLVAKLPIRIWLKWAASFTNIVMMGAASLFILRTPQPEFAIAMSTYSIAHVVTGIIAHIYLSHINQFNAECDQLNVDSKTDFLTGLYNFRQYDESLNTCFADAVNNGQVLSILFIDIDNFKRINDTYGHLAGDQILKTLADQLVAASRSTDIICRRGGEEFTIILPACNLDKACITAERIRKIVAAYHHELPNGNSIGITVSIGVSSYPETSSRTQDLIDQADSALYFAKHSGKNTVKTA